MDGGLKYDGKEVKQGKRGGRRKEWVKETNEDGRKMVGKDM